MSLKNFLDFRTNCPICHSKLSTYFSSQKKQQHFSESNCYVVKTPLYGINHRRKYSVGYNFNLDDDTFWIDFYTSDDQKMEGSFPKFLINKFKELDKNTSPHRFYRLCEDCNRYDCQTTAFALELNSGKITLPINVQAEYLGLSHKTNSGYNLFRVVNKFIHNESYVEFTKSDSTESLKVSSSQLHTNLSPHYSNMMLPLLPISSAEEAASRLSKLIVFS